jgi:hypothetical protein
MMRARFKPKVGVGFGKIKQLRGAHVEHVVSPDRNHPFDGEIYEVRFKGLDEGHEGKIREIPVRFYLERTSDDNQRLVYSMTMQDVASENRLPHWNPISRDFGPEGKELYSKYRGYEHAIPALMAFLGKKGIKRVWLPNADIIHDRGHAEMQDRVLRRIYDRTARRLGLGEATELPRELNVWDGNYYKLNSKDFEHLREGLEKLD